MRPFASVYGSVLVTTSAARQTPGGPGTTEPDAGWHWQNFWSGFAFTV